MFLNDLTKFLDGSSHFSTFLYFNSIVIIGGFFIIKLCLSAQYDAMKKVIKEKINFIFFEIIITSFIY